LLYSFCRKSPDFRSTGSKLLTTSSIFIIREVQQKQAWISDINKENDEEKLPFVGRFSLNDNPAVVARDILKTLNINPLNYRTGNVIKAWINAAEAKGIFVSRTSFINSHLTLDSDELQGFAISDPYAPFVFVNSDDWNAPQLFTLVHELAHIWIAETGISNDVEPEIRNNQKHHPVELFCNEVAANALMPADFFEGLDATTFSNANVLFKTAKLLGVSSFALLVRSFNLSKISDAHYHRLKQEADAEFAAFLQREVEKKLKQKDKETQSGPNYYLLQLNRNGRLFTQTVIDSFKGGFIEPTMASQLLNVQVTKFSKLEAQLFA